MKRKLLFLAMLGTILLCSVGCATPVNQKDPEPSPPTSSPSPTSPAETKQTPSLSPTPPATDGAETLPTLHPAPEPLWDFWMNFHPNGGENKKNRSDYIEHLHPGNPFPYEIPTPEKIGYSKEGYTFKHWNTKADGTGKAYEAGQIINGSDASFNLYAIWEKNR